MKLPWRLRLNHKRRRKNIMLTCNGNLTTTQSGSFVCDGAWQQVQILELLLSTPDSVDIQNAFMAGFTLPVIAYLTAWGFSVVIKFIKR